MSQAAVSINWLTDFEEATKQARADKKPVLVDVFQDDCGGCEKLVEVTFVEPQVAEAIATRFVPVQLDLRKNSEFARQWQVFWTPTILFADRSGKVRYQSPNFLPPAEFLDVLDIGEALVGMRWKEYDKSIRLLHELRDRSPSGPLTAEALYWRGIAAYFRDGSSSKSAHAEWQELLDTFPDSIWALRIP
ncbi:MAG: thioredoxin fold domain-containing protein [Thermomicrobiales bacterium]